MSRTAHTPRHASRPGTAAGGAARFALRALLVAAACTERPAPAPPAPPPAELESVVQRLDATAFGLAPAPHQPVAKIGDEAREVVLGPRWTTVASLHGVRLEDGKARREVPLPASVRGLPDDAFALEVRELPFAAEGAEEILAAFDGDAFTKRVESSWRLIRDPGRRDVVTLEFAPDESKQKVQFNLELRALEPQPARLESREFAPPPGATLELGYGAAGDRATSAQGAIRFRASLRCADSEAVELLDQTLTPGEQAWRDASFPLPGRGPCQLALAATGAGGEAARRTAWAIPRIVAALPPESARDSYNVVLVSLDTLRGDRLSSLGYPRETTPTIDAQLVARGTTFTDAMTTFPQTDVSHLSLFTGLYPEAQPERGRLPAGSPTPVLAEQLRDAGFTTAAFTEDVLVAGTFGFWFGFDRFVERTYSERERGGPTFAEAIEFLRENRGRRFFLFVHTYKTHKPYVAGGAYAGLFADGADWQHGDLEARVPAEHRAEADAYDRTVREADDLMGSLLAALEEAGLTGRTIVVLLSDHGEAFGEHGAVEHGFAGHQEQMHVPLIFRGPGIPEDLRIDTPVSLVDVAPTLLDLSGAAPLATSQGISLTPAFRGGELPEERPVFFSWITEGAAGVRRGRWKFLSAGHGHELFDLAEDPGEREPKLRRQPARPEDAALLAEHAEASAALRERLAAPSGSDSGGAITDRIEESLRALGYLH